MAKNVTRPDAGKYSAPALSKGLDILELLASRNRGLKKSEIATELDRSVSEIFRMLEVLKERGFVMLDPESERYALTMRLFELAHRHPPTKRLSTVASGVMEDIASRLNQSVHLAILHGSNILVIAQVDSPGNNITSVRLGARVPISVTASGAILTYRLPDDRRNALLKRLDEVKPETLEQFEASVLQAQEQNFCESPSLVIGGVHNISVPVFSYAGEVCAALTIPYIQRLTGNGDPDFDTCREALVAAGVLISQNLGAGAADREI